MHSCSLRLVVVRAELMMADDDGIWRVCVMDCTRAHLADMLQNLIVPIGGYGFLWTASGKVQLIVVHINYWSFGVRGLRRRY